VVVLVCFVFCFPFLPVLFNSKRFVGAALVSTLKFLRTNRNNFSFVPFATVVSVEPKDKMNCCTHNRDRANSPLNGTVLTSGR
jgi:hypothetical protein